jgi:hypothetical protein
MFLWDLHPSNIHLRDIFLGLAPVDIFISYFHLYILAPRVHVTMPVVVSNPTKLYTRYFHGIFHRIYRPPMGTLVLSEPQNRGTIG